MRFCTTISSRYNQSSRYNPSIFATVCFTTFQSHATLRDAIKGNLMLELVRAKYTQNEALRRELVATGNRTLGETGKDTFYSIGIPLTHPDVLNCRKWKAGNKLGKALETVRADLA